MEIQGSNMMQVTLPGVEELRLQAGVVGAGTDSTLQHRERSCVSTLASLSPAVLGCALVSGARH